MTEQATIGSDWREVFHGWPEDVPRRGVLVTTLNEQIPFDNFATGQRLLFLDRSTPDAMGGRKVLVPFECIAILKFTDVVKSRAFTALGFSTAVKT